MIERLGRSSLPRFRRPFPLQIAQTTSNLMQVEVLALGGEGLGDSMSALRTRL
jgi:hypothetical protein